MKSIQLKPVAKSKYLFCVTVFFYIHCMLLFEEGQRYSNENFTATNEDSDHFRVAALSCWVRVLCTSEVMVAQVSFVQDLYFLC